MLDCRLQKVDGGVWLFVNVPLDYAPHVTPTVERVQVWLWLCQSYWRSSAPVSPWPRGRVQSSAGRHMAFPWPFGRSRASPRYGEPAHALRHTPEVLSREVRRHDVSLVGDDVENHDGGCEFCMHDVGRIRAVLAQPPVVSPVHFLILIELSSSKKNKAFGVSQDA